MSEIPAGLESLSYCFAGGRPAGAFAPVLVGVVGSGNLEVMLESTGGDGCEVQVQTSAHGFGAIWQAVVEDFRERHPVGGVRVSRSEEHTSELQSPCNLVCRLLLEKKTH